MIQSLGEDVYLLIRGDPENKSKYDKCYTYWSLLKNRIDTWRTYYINTSSKPLVAKLKGK